MSGSIGLSLTQRYDKTSHEPLDGGQLQFYAAGTTTPQSAYQDVSLTIPWPNPMTLDSGGNVPQLFFADGYIKFRLSNSAGVTQIEADNVLVLGPTSGVGAAPSVDATTILATGDIKSRYGTGALTGFVRANGRTIGSAASSASERANADCQTLFEYLWNTDGNLSVSTGRGASANADWTANKTIALPDWRGRAMVGMDDMGNSAAGVLTVTYFGAGTTSLGIPGGAESTTLQTSYLPAYVPTGTFLSGTLNSGTLNSGTVVGGAFSGSITSGSLAIATRAYVTSGSTDATHLSASSNIGSDIGTTSWTALSGSVSGSVTGGVTGTVSGTVSGTLSMNAQGGSSTPFSNIMPARTITFYIKL